MLKPTFYYNSLFEIKPRLLLDLNKTIILLDLDNTLVDFNKVYPSKEAVDYVNSLSTTFKVIAVSNNNLSRVFLATTGMNCEYLYKVHKPFAYKLNKYFKDNNINIENCLIIGDQLYTDIKFANKMHIDSILVEPTTNNDLFITKLNRSLDKRLRSKLKEKGLLKKIC